ncbi:AGAP001348-PA [Anopheles gambiae str. PEST]|uniref:AGAP001348-PA n=1 Tax=Anopheles gambiae TaxID=7165 RepID=Q7PXD3_ANOGA|nr:AGAP001348-PA [Anopheles gambiae str. PEST]
MNDNIVGGGGAGGGKVSTGGPGALCKVCGDRASGKHYGVPSCDGCRGFFKRSIRRNLEYVCKEGGKCVVDVSRRNQCQACRFAKCLQANMRREGKLHTHTHKPTSVQHERAPRNCTPLTATVSGLSAHGDYYAARTSFAALPQANLFFPLPLHITAAAASGPFAPIADPGRFLSPYAAHITGDSLVLPAPPPIHSISSILSLSSAKENEVSSTGEESPPRGSSGQQQQQQQQQQQYHHSVLFGQLGSITGSMHAVKSETDMLLESAAKLLFLAVKWAKTVPSFLQLPANDQKLLLEEAWAELFVITAAQWGLPIDNEFIARNPQAVKLQSAIQQFGIARVDYREAACLKALVLFRPDQPRLYAAHEVLLLQDQTVALLHEKCGGVRLGHLLLLLPAIKAAANAKVLQEMLFRKTVGEVAIERLLLDLMKT